MNTAEVSRLYDFTGRVIVITGAMGVLGGEIAGAIAGCGGNVVLLDRNLDPAADLLDAMGPDAASRAIVAGADVLDVATLKKASTIVLEQFGRVDGLVNAVGGDNPDATTSADRGFFDLRCDALRSVVDLNLLGTVLPSQVFGRIMAEQGEGAILNITSIEALRPFTRVPAYSAAKAAVNNFTAWLAVHVAQEYSPRIRVNAVAPGFFATRRNEYLVVDAHNGALTAQGETIAAHTPMGRLGRPEDLIGAVLWLLSPASAFVTGVVVPVDGGFSAFSGV